MLFVTSSRYLNETLKPSSKDACSAYGCTTRLLVETSGRVIVLCWRNLSTYLLPKDMMKHVRDRRRNRLTTLWYGAKYERIMKFIAEWLPCIRSFWLDSFCASRSFLFLNRSSGCSKIRSARSSVLLAFDMRGLPFNSSLFCSSSLS